MESNFHSTVLQRPPVNDDRDQTYDGGDRRRARDILNPASPPTLSHQPDQTFVQGSRTSQSSTAFALRSPSQSTFYHPQPPSSAHAQSASPPTIPSSIPNGSRTSPHHQHLAARPTVPPNPFMQSGPSNASSLPPPPPLQPLQPPTAAPATSTASQPPPRSPLHAPPIYYPHDTREPPRESIKPATRSFYDPTTDTTTTTTDRTVSDAAASSWPNSTQASTPKVSRRVLFSHLIQPSFGFALQAKQLLFCRGFCSCPGSQSFFQDAGVSVLAESRQNEAERPGKNHHPLSFRRAPSKTSQTLRNRSPKLQTKSKFHPRIFYSHSSHSFFVLALGRFR
jgi:hypothetical protein